MEKSFTSLDLSLISKNREKQIFNYDLCLLLMGKTGSGKSSILNKICKENNKFPEGHTLDSKTDESKFYESNI